MPENKVCAAVNITLDFQVSHRIQVPVMNVQQLIRKKAYTSFEKHGEQLFTVLLFSSS